MIKRSSYRLSRVRSLRALTVFADATDDELLRIDQQTTRIDVAAGRRLTVEGSAGRDAMIVIDGRARVTHRGRVIAEIGPGELIGEMALLNGSRRSATVVALTPMRLMVLNPGEFQEMLRVAPSVRAKVGAVAFERGAQPRRTARDGRGSPVLGSNDASAPVGDARAKGGNHASVRLA